MTVDKFIIMCHNIYDKIHGKNKINYIFNNFNQEILQQLIKIYNSTFLDRHTCIKKFASENEMLDEKYVEFYINSIQHFLSIYKIE